jgi:hypothetical protein
LIFEDMAVVKMAYRMTVNDRTANDVREGHRGPVGMKRLASWGLLLFVAVCALTGCERGKLLKVERLMESDIDAADTLIYSMGEPCGKRNRAIYAMLKTQIDYKQYRDIPNDSLIRIATDYYGKKYKNYHAAMAWYSLGCVSGLNGQDSTATDAYLTALALFPDTMVRYYALAEQNLSYIYLKHSMDAEAIQLIKACRANAVRLQDSAAIAFCDYNIANAFLYNDDYYDAKAIFLELKDNKWLSSDTKDDPFLQLSKIAQLADQDYYQSLNYVDSFIIRNHHELPYGQAYSVKADAYYGLNLLDSAQLYYDLSLTEATDAYMVCDAYRRLSEIQSIKNNRDSATYYAKLASAWMDTIAATNSSSVIFRIINKYSKSSFNPKNKHYHYFIILLTICIIFISGFLFVYYKRIHKKTESIADFADDIVEFRNSSLYLEMVNVVHNQEELSTKNKNLFEKKFRKSLIGLREFIIKSSTQMSSIEIDYCIYTILGFRQKDFVLFYNISPSGSRNIKARIKDKTPEQLFNNIFS